MSDDVVHPRVSRRTLLRNSGLIAVAAGAATVGVAGSAEAGQSNWRWCWRCEGLWFNDHAGYGRCPRGGGHTFSGSGNYMVKFAGDGGNGQRDWRWCWRCEGLWFNGNPGYGRCPAGGGHALSGSGDYRLEMSISNDGPGGQREWRWCWRCEGLWFNGNPYYGTCPAGGGHSYSGSGEYMLRTV
jgi:hypothetical protein